MSYDDFSKTYGKEDPESRILQPFVLTEPEQITISCLLEAKSYDKLYEMTGIEAE